VIFARLPLLPLIGAELHLSPAEIGLFTGVFGLGRLATDIPVGRLADRAGVPALLLGSGIASAAGSALLAVAPGQPLLLLGALVLGVVSATTNAGGQSYFSLGVPPRQRGMALGILTTALLAGQMVGPAVAGLLSDRVGWRATEVVVGLVAVPLALASVAARDPGRSGRRPDQAASRATRSRIPRPERAALYLIPFSMFFAVASSVQTLVPIVAAYGFGLSAGELGVLLAAITLLRSGIALAGGLLADRWGQRRYLVPGTLLMAAGMLGLAQTWSLPAWVAGLVLLQAGSTAANAGIALLADRSTRESLGRDLGEYRFVGDIGLIAGPLLVTFLYEGLGLFPSQLPVIGLLLLSAAASSTLLHEPARERRR
jgi:MFS transporter, FSR family, fosmidomycin resistance protein